MKLGILILILPFIVGCSPATQQTPPTPTAAPQATATVISKPIATVLPTNIQSPSPGNTRVSATAQVNQIPTSTPTRQVINTPSSPSATTIPTVAPAGTLFAGGKTFISSIWQVAVDYPPDWSVREDAAGVVFRSPQGAMILLASVETGGLSPEDFLSERQLPNTRCSSSTNAYGVTARVCFDTIASSYDASIVLKSAAGGARLLSWSTRTRLQSDLQVFNAMVASVRPLP